MEAVVDIATWACLLIGAAFSLIGSIGLLRFPDVFTRMHAASLIETMGAGLILLGLGLQAGLSLISAKLALIFIFLFFTNPTTTHALSRAIVHSGIKPYVKHKEGDAK